MAEVPSRGGCSSKKELLSSLISSLLQEIPETEKKELLQAVLKGNSEHCETIEMVEHWIKKCTDSGVSPIDMSKEVLASISNTYELSSYATPELKSLFNDWLSEIEQLITAFVNKKNRVDPDEVAKEFKLKCNSVIFIISKLAREGRITMQATTKKKAKISPLRKTKWKKTLPVAEL